MSMFKGIRCLLLMGLVASTTSFVPNVVPIAAPLQRLNKEHSIALRLAHESVNLEDLSAVYSSLIGAHYYPTQSVVGGIFCFVGDAIAQLVVQDDNSDRKGSYDPQRGVIYFCKGLGGGILWASWFEVVDPLANQLTGAVLLGQSASPSVEQGLRTAISILLEQFLVCPIFYSCWDIPLPALLRGSPPRQIPAQIREKLSPLLVANAKVWTPVNLITYNIPTEYRVLFTSCADIFWQGINAFITSKEIQVADVATGGIPSTTSKLQPDAAKVAPTQVSVK